MSGVNNRYSNIYLIYVVVVVVIVLHDTKQVGKAPSIPQFYISYKNYLLILSQASFPLSKRSFRLLTFVIIIVIVVVFRVVHSKSA